MKISPQFTSVIETLCAAHDAKPLFLTFFGSTLYGTAIDGKSDLDIKGIFLPALKDIILGKTQNSLRFSTSASNVSNHAGDIDIELWSLQHWLLNLLPKGDTGALDLLFAPSNAACTLLLAPELKAVFENREKFVNLRGDAGYAAYCLGQARKYGIRGSRVGAIKKAHEWLNEHCPQAARHERLGAYLDQMASACGDHRHCSIILNNGRRALNLCGKIHMETISMAEFAQRVKKQFDQCGHRAILAERNEGLDFKALSHAVRALSQVEELIGTGKITYPLHNRAELTAIKKGMYSWRELEQMITERLDHINGLCAASGKFTAYDMELAEKIVLSFYQP